MYSSDLSESAYDDTQVRAALVDCGLETFVPRLDESAHWQLLMSGGEQQRLAVARALLLRPDYLFLDEATASLDESGESRVYTALRERLAKSAIVSIAHRPGVRKFHDKLLSVETSNGVARLVAA